MDATEILKPLVVQAGLMVLLTFWLGWTRASSIKKSSMKEIAQKGWPKLAQNASDNYTNQYEMPVLFFVVGILLYLTNSVTPLAIGLAWFYVATRIIHALIHVSVNIIPYRFLAFVIGGLALTGLYILLVMAVF